jgi:hypothetical protein
MPYRHPVRAAAYLLAVVFIACAGTSESDKKALGLIAQAKSATGGNAWDQIEIWHETGHATLPDMGTIRYEHWHDAQSLNTRNVRSDASGGLNYMLFNGSESYQSTDADFHDRTPIDPNEARNGAYLVAFGFLFPARFPASFHYEGLKSDKGVPFDVVTVSPRGLKPVDLWLDLNTHRIFRIVSDGGRSHEDLSDYREVTGVLVPFHAVGDGMTFITDTVRFEPRGSVRFSP